MNRDNHKYLNGFIGFLIGVVITGAVAGSFLYNASSVSASSSPTTPSTATSPPVIATSPEPSPTPSSTPTPTAPPKTTTPNAPPAPALLLTGALVTQLGNQSLTVNINRTFYTVKTTSSTSYLRMDSSASNFNELSINDLVNVYGTYTDSTHSTISASKIIDDSIIQTLVTSHVTSVDTSNNMLQISNPESTNLNLELTVSPTTNITDKNGNLTYLPNINTGDTVAVYGLYDQTNSTITHISSLTDFNISA